MSAIGLTSRIVDATPLTVAGVTASTRSHRAISSADSAPDCRARSRTTSECPRRPAARTSRNVDRCGGVATPDAHVSTPTPSRRGTASRSARDPSRPVEVARSSHRTPAVSSRPRSSVESRPDRVGVDHQRGSVSSADLTEGTGQRGRARSTRAADDPEDEPTTGRLLDVREECAQVGLGRGQLHDGARPQIQGESEHLGRGRVGDDHDARSLWWRDGCQLGGEVVADHHQRRAAPTRRGRRPGHRPPRSGPRPRRRAGPGRRGVGGHG